MKRFSSLGIPSAIFIVFLMCLTLFGLLCINDAGRAKKYADNYAERVQDYYTAEAKAAEYAAAMKKAYDNGENELKMPEDSCVEAQTLENGVLTFSSRISDAMKLRCAYDLRTGKITDWHTETEDTEPEPVLGLFEIFDFDE